MLHKYINFSHKIIIFHFFRIFISFNKKKGTIRGLHFQRPPHKEAKLVRCTKGSIFDVIIDLRINSSTYRKWIGTELSENNHKIIYVPESFAHGFQTLADNSEIFYQMSEYYNPESSRGFRFDDPSIDISWPLKLTTISQKDEELPFFDNIPFSDLQI